MHTFQIRASNKTLLFFCKPLSDSVGCLGSYGNILDCFLLITIERIKACIHFTSSIKHVQISYSFDKYCNVHVHENLEFSIQQQKQSAITWAKLQQCAVSKFHRPFSFFTIEKRRTVGMFGLLECAGARNLLCLLLKDKIDENDGGSNTDVVTLTSVK